MVLDCLAHADRYACLADGLAEAFAFLRRPDLAELTDGRREIDGDSVYAIVARGKSKPREDARLEIHRRYIDVQFCVAGTDVIGWRELSRCTLPPDQFDEQADCGFLSDEPHAWVALPRGSFMILFPSDAHAPLAGTGALHKVVVKVALPAPTT